MSLRRSKTAVVLFVLLVLQVTLFAHLRPFGVAPDGLLVAALLGGIVGGPDFGARNGFAAGLLLDLVVPGAFGLAAGVYATFGYGIGFVSRSIDSEDPRVLPILVLLMSFLATAAYGLGLGVLGSEQFVEWRLLGVSAGVAVLSIGLAIPVRNAYRWVVADPHAVARTEPAKSMVN